MPSALCVFIDIYTFNSSHKRRHLCRYLGATARAQPNLVRTQPRSIGLSLAFECAPTAVDVNDVGWHWHVFSCVTPRSTLSTSSSFKRLLRLIKSCTSTSSIAVRQLMPQWFLLRLALNLIMFLFRRRASAPLGSFYTDCPMAQKQSLLYKIGSSISSAVYIHI